MTSSSRVHVVLVPGFAGFDALGQLEYYAGITPLFRTWQAGLAGGSRQSLHYFDNLPTASVATRARRLRGYLATRRARGELLPGDEVALVGHSTGGLDIRRLLLDLDAEARSARPAPRVDGGRDEGHPVGPDDLLGLVTRVAFLSVPQLGTNIADFVRAHPTLRKAAIAELQALVGAASLSPLNDLEERAAAWAARHSRADLFLALRDAVGEIDVRGAGANSARIAEAQEAGAELGLWLRHVATDFGAIDDLSAAPSAPGASPAHATPAARLDELAMWRERGIRTRSWATLGTRLYDFAAEESVPPWELLEPSTAPGRRLADGMRERVDVTYLTCYRACAGGPFPGPRPGETRLATRFGTSEKRVVHTWDNDGIVNTASMLWPDGDATPVLDGDHADVIGHHRLIEAAEGGLRRYHTYDLLRSDSGFTARTLEALWREIFAFCAGEWPRGATAAP